LGNTDSAKIKRVIYQPKIIYYGTESGTGQDKSIFDIPSHGDLQVRKPMNWNNPNKEFLDFYKELIHQSS
jgi:hypothetical protein